MLEDIQKLLENGSIEETELKELGRLPSAREIDYIYTINSKLSPQQHGNLKKFLNSENDYTSYVIEFLDEFYHTEGNLALDVPNKRPRYVTTVKASTLNEIIGLYAERDNVEFGEEDILGTKSIGNVLSALNTITDEETLAGHKPNSGYQYTNGIRREDLEDIKVACNLTSYETLDKQHRKYDRLDISKLTKITANAD